MRNKTVAKRSSAKPIAFNGMFWNVQILLIQAKALISIILWVLNAILFSAAFRHIPFGCECCASSGQTKVQQPLNRSEAELDEVNVPERSVYALYNWRDVMPIWDIISCMGADLQRA